MIFGFVIVGIYLLIERKPTWREVLVRCAMIVGLAGLITFMRSPIIDIVAGPRASKPTAMGALQTQLNSHPNTPLSPYYNIGPLLFQFGLMMLIVQLAILRPRQLPWWSPLLLGSGFLVLGFDLDLPLCSAQFSSASL